MITWAFAWLLVKLRDRGCDESIIAVGVCFQCLVSIAELAAMFYIVQELAG